MKRSRRKQTQDWLTARRRKTDVLARVGLILRGPALAVPLWVPKHLLACAGCMRLRHLRYFGTYRRAGGDLRCEPVCNDCIPTPEGQMFESVVRLKIKRALYADGAVVHQCPEPSQFLQLVTALAWRAEGREWAIGLLFDALDNAKGLLERWARAMRHEFHIHSLGPDYLNVDIPRGSVCALTGASNWTGWKFDVLFDLRGTHA